MHTNKERNATGRALGEALLGLVVIALLGIGIYSAFIGIGEAFDFSNPVEGAPALVAAALAFGFLGLIMKPA